MNEYYNDFGITRVNKKFAEKQELYKLFKKPTKASRINTPHFNQTYSANIDQQADLLFLPEDKGYKYALVVVDTATRQSDAEPLKGKTSAEVKKAFEKIYKRDILKMPEFMMFDSGSEFHGVVKSYFEDNDVSVKYGKPGKHTQLSIVERTNQYLAKAMFRRMHAQEILTGEVSKEWIEDLPKFIKAINRKRTKALPKVSTEVLCEKDACDLLDIGTKVRVVLFDPIDYTTGSKLHGKFRITDIRWNPDIRTIKNILLLPGRPPIYLVNKENGEIDNSAGYTKNQLQVVTDDEEAPDMKVIRGKPKTFIIQKIVSKKKEKGKYYYEVKWKGQPNTTWQLATELEKDVPDLVEDYEYGV